MKVAVIGAGSWGTALATVLCDNNHNVTLWSYRTSQIEELNNTRINSSKLPGVKLPESMKFSDNLEEAVTSNEILILAVPSKATRATLEKMKPFIKEGQGVVTVSKGIEEETLYTQSQIIEDVLDGVKIGVLSGPSHAEEVVKRMPTVVVCGSHDRAFAIKLQEMFMNENFRVYTSFDVLGIEIGGASKNVIALAAGMSDGIGFGDNAKAALITRGVKEITDLALAMGADIKTLNGLTGIGDLIVTCQSLHSRNRMAGFYMGQGMSREEAMDKVKMVVEGVYSAKAVYALGKKYDVELPIIEQVNQALFEGATVESIVRALMTRDKKAETDYTEWD